MNKEIKAYLRIQRIIAVLEYGDDVGSKRACKAFGIPKSRYYKWRNAWLKGGRDGLIRKKPTAKNFPNMISQEVVENVLDLRKTYQLGPCIREKPYEALNRLLKKG